VPGVYTELSFYADWINDQVNPQREDEEQEVE